MNGKALCYVRVSTKRQEDQPRQDEQIRSMERYCNDKGWLDYEIIPESFSAQTIHKRKIFKEVLNRLERGEAKYLLIHTIDRLSRNAEEAQHIGKLSLKQGWKLVITTMIHIDIGRDADWFQFSMLTLLAENEVRTISTRVTEGTRRAKEMGLPVGGERHPPLDPKIVKKIFYYRYNNYTTKEIAVKLNDLGLESVHNSCKSGKLWNSRKVEKVIYTHNTQGVYVGLKNKKKK